MKKIILSIVFLNLIMASSFAQVASKSEQIEDVLSHNSYSPNFFSLIFGLLFVICLIYFTGIVYKKLIKVKIGDIEKDSAEIRILKHMPLGQGKNLYVIKIGSTCCLIGATQNSINHIKDLDEKDFIKDVEQPDKN